MTEKDFLTKTLTEQALSRRSFLKVSAAVGGAAALVGGVSFGLKAVESAAEQTQSDGKWVVAACWHNCGGRCPNYAYVQDGVIVRQKPDDTHPDSPDFPQQRGCARGRSQRHQTFGADRLKYPMKRKNWEPGGGNKELRGRDEWVRISWDEALNIVASEIKRIKEKYGNTSILCTGGSEIGRALTLYGGYVGHYGTTSGGSWHTTEAVVRGAYNNRWRINDRMQHRKVQLFVHFGANPISSSGGNPTYNSLQNKLGGAKYIFIDPQYSDSAQILADEWIPIRPATDHAMVLGMCHTLFTEDDPETNPLIDWDFINRCTTGGITRDFLPEGAEIDENLKDYVLGLDASGNPAPKGHKNYPPKTPEWASEICGVDPDRIRTLAREIATTENVAICQSNACARTQNSDSWPQMLLTFGAMTGHIGKDGSFTSGGYYHQTFSGYAGGPSYVTSGGAGVPGVGDNPVQGERSDVWTVLPKVPGVQLCDAWMWQAIYDKKYQAAKDEWRDLNIQLIYHGGGAALQTRDGMTKGIEAHRQVEFVVAHGQFLTTNAKYADVVLPVTTEWERFGNVSSANNEIGFIWSSQVTEPQYETKDDIWIAAEVGKRLSLDPNEIDPVPLKQQIFNRISGAKVMKDDVPNAQGEYETLVTITEDDIKEWDVEGEPQTGHISLKELQEKGYYQVPRSPGDNYEFIAQKEFREDPENNPIPTESGKLETYSQRLADIIYSRGWSTVRPIPTYNPAQEGYEATFDDWENKVKGKYPLQLGTMHYFRRSHTVFDNIPQLRRAFPNEFFMNPVDAEARGIQHGDIVLIESKHGKTIRPVCVTPRIIPGVVNLPHGAWVEMDEETGVDKAGADNIINGCVPTGQGTSGWNTCIVEVSKYEGPIELKPDYQWPQRIPLKEA
jgi:anaerobic dimethyl sulfoxide reductase subunit A